MHRASLSAVAALMVIALASGFAQARTQVVPLWPGAPPGTETWTQKERVLDHTPIGTVVLNVVKPTLTAYVPDRSKATGTGVIIAPGGACVALAIGVEGNDVARWLQSRGIAAFVLKYRIVEKRQEGIPNLDMDQACKYGIADAIQAVGVVRAHAAEWGVDPQRVGLLGFSAGGMVASGALLQPDAAARPNFAAFVYGAPLGVMPVIPSGLPPVFMAWAQDDPMVLNAIVKFYAGLRDAHDKTEAHIFASGGHGFGMRKQGTSSDRWIDEFYYWLQAQGFARAR